MNFDRLKILETSKKRVFELERCLMMKEEDSLLCLCVYVRPVCKKCSSTLRFKTQWKRAKRLVSVERLKISENG